MAERAAVPPPRVAAVILTFNGGDKTLAAIESLVATEEAHHVLLWDNGSVDDTADRVARRFPSVIVHRSPTNLGVASGRNAAAELAMARFDPTHLLFLDDDMVVRPGFVAGLLAPFAEDPRVGQTQAKLLFLNDPSRVNYGGGIRVRFWIGSTVPVGFGELDRGQYDRRSDCVACGGAMMVRADLFRLLAGFDPVFDPFGPEDLDFSLRLQGRGYRSIYAPEAVALHAGSGTFEGGKWSQLYAQKRTQHWLDFLRRHGSMLEQVGFFAIGAPYRAARMIGRAAATGNPGILRGMMSTAAGVLGGRRVSRADDRAAGRGRPS